MPLRKVADCSKMPTQGAKSGAMTGKQLCIAGIAAFDDLPLVQLPVVVSPAVWGSNRPPRRA
jgi:hypothetical protein